MGYLSPLLWDSYRCRIHIALPIRSLDLSTRLIRLPESPSQSMRYDLRRASKRVVAWISA